MKKVILVGRHAGEIPGVEVVEQVNQVWALDADEAFEQLMALHESAFIVGASLLFQNVPGILAVAFRKLSRHLAVAWVPNVDMGVVISKPGPRQAAAFFRFWVADDYVEDVKAAILHANGRARVEVISHSFMPVRVRTALVNVTVDPVAAFEFDHIEWM